MTPPEDAVRSRTRKTGNECSMVLLGGPPPFRPLSSPEGKGEQQGVKPGPLTQLFALGDLIGTMCGEEVGKFY